LTAKSRDHWLPVPSDMGSAELGPGSPTRDHSCLVRDVASAFVPRRRAMVLYLSDAERAGRDCYAVDRLRKRGPQCAAAEGRRISFLYAPASTPKGRLVGKEKVEVGANLKTRSRNTHDEQKSYKSAQQCICSRHPERMYFLCYPPPLSSPMTIQKVAEPPHGDGCLAKPSSSQPGNIYPNLSGICVDIVSETGKPEREHYSFDKNCTGGEAHENAKRG